MEESGVGEMQVKWAWATKPKKSEVGWRCAVEYDVSGSAHTLSDIMKRRISSARACVKVLQSFSYQVFTGGRSPLVLVVSVRLDGHKESLMGAAWSGRSLPTCLRPLSRMIAPFSVYEPERAL
jgi:hypothetical protein